MKEKWMFDTATKYKEIKKRRKIRFLFCVKEKMATFATNDICVLY